MSYRTRPYKSGSILKFAELFIAPILYAKPKATPVYEWLETIFHVKSRPITKNRVLQNFKMPGKIWLSGGRKASHYGERQVKAKSLVFIRNEPRAGLYHAEAQCQPTGKWQVFTLNQEQHTQVQRFLKKEEFKGTGRDFISWELDGYN